MRLPLVVPVVVGLLLAAHERHAAEGVGRFHARGLVRGDKLKRLRSKLPLVGGARAGGEGRGIFWGSLFAFSDPLSVSIQAGCISTARGRVSLLIDGGSALWKAAGVFSGDGGVSLASRAFGGVNAREDDAIGACRARSGVCDLGCARGVMPLAPAFRRKGLLTRHPFFPSAIRFCVYRYST